MTSCLPSVYLGAFLRRLVWQSGTALALGGNECRQDGKHIYCKLDKLENLKNTYHRALLLLISLLKSTILPFYNSQSSLTPYVL